MSTISEFNDGSHGPVAPLGRTFGIARPAAKRLAMASFLGAGAIAADIALIGTAACLISKAAQHPNEAALGLAIVGVQFFGLSRGLLRYKERLVGHDAAFALLASLRVEVYNKLERLAPAGIPEFRRGDLLARMVQDVDSLQDLVIRVIPPFAIAGLVGTATVIFMWFLLPAAAVILAIALLVAAIVVPGLTGALARRKETRFAQVRGDLSAAIVDLVEGAPELLAFGATGAQIDTIQEHDAELTAIASSSAGTAGIGLALTTLLAGLASWGCLVTGISAVASGRLNVTALAVVTLVPLAAVELVVGLPVATQSLQRVRRVAARVFEVTGAPPPVCEPDRPLPVPPGPYRLDARAVWAGYSADANPALLDASVELPPGQRLAIVGPSGAGKSTLAAVLLRFLPFVGGSVTLNGTSLEDLSGDDLRTVVGLVGQDAHLFDTTIADNLRLGKPEATVQELDAVLDRVGLSGWLESLPKGLVTQVGRQGTRLSGGQRQRVAVARALLADFPVLVLDEPAEHLEPAAADALNADLLGATEGRSVVLITHRLAGLESVDEILVMDAGRVLECGTHEVLLRNGGRYAALWWMEISAERSVTTEDHHLPDPLHSPGVTIPRGTANERSLIR